MKRFVTLFAAMSAVAFAWADSWTDPQTGLQWTYIPSTNGEATIGDGLAAAIPTDTAGKDDVFRASVTIVNGKQVVSYTPELTEAEKSRRVYRTYGKVRLGDDGWTLVPEGREADYNFFKVTVELK